MIQLQQSSIEKIRADFETHILYVAINSAFPRAISGRYALSAEQVFVEVVKLLDILKRQQEDVQWDDLYEYLEDECSRSCKDIRDDELHAIVSTIIMALSPILLYAPYRHYKHLGKSLMEQHLEKNSFVEQRQKIERMVGAMDRKMRELREWLVEYMNTEGFLSQRLKTYYEQEKKDMYAHRFKYMNKNVPEEKAMEIEAKFHQVAAENEHPSQDLIDLIRYEYSTYLSVSGVGAKKVWKEFHDFYGLKQSYATFCSHYPNQLKSV